DLGDHPREAPALEAVHEEDEGGRRPRDLAPVEPSPRRRADEDLELEELRDPLPPPERADLALFAGELLRLEANVHARRRHGARTTNRGAGVKEEIRRGAGRPW